MMQLKRKQKLIILLTLYIALLLNFRVCSSDSKSDFLALINQYRQSQNPTITILKVSSALTTAAQHHSEDMAAHNYFSHTSFDGRTFVDRIRAAGYTYSTYLGENIAAGFDTAQKVFDAWKSSPDHNANMLNPNYVVIGIGLAYNASSTYGWYWTTDFGGYDDSGTPPPPPPPSNNPPSVPATPSGPSSGYSGTSYSFSTNSADPDGDQLKYIFDWGDGTTSTTGLQPSGSTGSLSHTWSRQDEFHVWVRATDSKGVSSDWSSPFTITIQNRPPNTPSTPSGSATGYTATAYAFTTSAADPDGNQLQYTFDWGDGSNTLTGFSASGSTASASHTWSQTGTYSIKVRATDTDGAGSGWSSPVIIDIENAPPNTPTQPSGTTSCTLNSAYEYSVYASDPDGESVCCIFDWGDGATTETSTQSSGSSFKASHSWVGLGTYSVKVKAIDSAGKESPWSQPATVVVKLPSTITLSIPIDTIARGEKLTVSGVISPPLASMVTLTYRKPDGSQITKQVESDGNGKYLNIIAPDTVGTWGVQASWNGDGDHFGASTSTTTFHVDPALCSVTFETNATGVGIFVDGVNYTLPQSFRWLEGTVHTVALEGGDNFTQGGRYLFKSWDDGYNDTSRNIVVKDPITYIAIFVTQYQATIRIYPNSSLCEDWYDANKTIQLSVNSTTMPTSPDSRLVFTGWSNNASSMAINVTVNGPMAVEAEWKRQFLVRVVSPYGQAGGDGWHDEGSEVALSLYPAIVDCRNGTRRLFELWAGTGAGSYSGNEPNRTLIISGPVNESATWRTQYLVTINSTQGHPLGAGWYYESELAGVSIERAVYDSETTRYTFQFWKGIGTNNRVVNMTTQMNSPISIEAVWQRELYLNVCSAYGETWGMGWYCEGSNASFGVKPPQPNIIGYVFEGWTGDESTNTLNATTIMYSPKNMIAKWHRDYTQVTVLSTLGAVGAIVLIYSRTHKVAEAKRKREREAHIIGYESIYS